MSFNVYRADIVDLWRNGKNVCITVSQEVRRKDLCGVVDRGNALALAAHVPGLARLLGEFIMIGKGNVGFVAEKIIAFFTKPRDCKFERGLPDEINRYSWGQRIPGGHCMADPVIVARSARQLLRLTIKERLREVYLPVPAIQNGRLEIEDIKEALDVVQYSTTVRLISNTDIVHPRIVMRDLP